MTSANGLARRSRAQGAPVAIVGMAGRFPGARNIDEFRSNVLNGVEAISALTDDDLRAAGAGDRDLRDPYYVKAAAIVDEADMLDASVFGMSARDAQVMDPQFRVFLESAHAALTDAGLDPGRFHGRVGIYAGSRDNSYLEDNVYRNRAIMRAVGSFLASIQNNTDYLATNAAYRLGLTGPAVTMVTACSTSLVAVHSAVQALRNGECEAALAGGVEIALPQVNGYLYREGGIYSNDGHIRTFDASASGTVFGNGCAVVLLKLLDDALADRDSIYAIIRGSAVNNDGKDKDAFSAPGRRGQEAVYRASLADALVDVSSIGYVEAHGTGTLVGDPIEVNALTSVFRSHTERRGYCFIGSVKPNIGHLGAAAGVSGLINAVMSVRDGLVAPSINFSRPNPRIDFGNSPFVVNTAMREWMPQDGPRRAAVNSFGIGGTNANVIIEQAPDPVPAPPSAKPYQLLTLSAQSSSALDRATGDLVGRLTADDAQLADIAYTLSTGRAALRFRRFAVAAEHAEAAGELAGGLGAFETARRTNVFLFPGQGAQYPGMA